MIIMQSIQQGSHIKTALQQISSELSEYQIADGSPGLLSGFTGHALFYVYYYQLTGEEVWLEKAYDLIAQSMEYVATTALDGSFCNGLAGIGWCLQHFAKLDLIDANEDIFTQMDDLLAGFMEDELLAGKTDYLHEGLGSALYFLERWPEGNATEQFTKLVSQLIQSVVITSAGITWTDNFSNRYNKPVFNMGLAHGVPSIIAILARIHAKGIPTDHLIDGCIQWLRAGRNRNVSPDHSLYPMIVDEDLQSMDNPNSRLAWCYGDLGIAAAIMNAGIYLENTEYQQEAAAIFLHAAEYRTLSNGLVHDACFCHGSAGIAHIFQRAAIFTGDERLNNAADAWLQNTLQMPHFRFYQHNDYIESYNILEGLAGIGLSLISFADPQLTPTWNNSLLLF
jgi:lantibiotic biosynthesis protein